VLTLLDGLPPRRRLGEPAYAPESQALGVIQLDLGREEDERVTFELLAKTYVLGDTGAEKQAVCELNAEVSSLAAHAHICGR
jgi:hypothetical protein